MAPIVIVVLGSIGLTGLVPKAIISAYLCFFPVAIGIVKGLTSPDALSRDLLRTYSATQAQTLWKLRLPASLPFLFASLKVAIAISLVGAIVGELPTGAQAGLGARLLSGSYYGQTDPDLGRPLRRRRARLAPCRGGRPRRAGRQRAFGSAGMSPAAPPRRRSSSRSSSPAAFSRSPGFIGRRSRDGPGSRSGSSSSPSGSPRPPP